VANYSCKVFPYDLKVSHNTSVTDGRTDGDRETDDNHANSSTVT